MRRMRCLPFFLVLCCACMSFGGKQRGGENGLHLEEKVKGLNPVGIIGDRKLGSASLYLPIGIAVDPLGNIFITDTGNDRVVKCDGEGRFLAEAGGFGWGSREFNRPAYIATDNGLNIYVVDAQNKRIQRLDRSLNFVSTLEIREQNDFLGLGLPQGIGITFSGEILVSDMESDQVFKLNSFFEYERSFGGFGESETGLRDPKGIFVDRDGDVYVADSQNSRIVVFDSFGNTLRSFGEQVLEDPNGVAVGKDGLVYVANSGKNSVVVFDPDGNALAEYGKSIPGMANLSRPTDLKVVGESQLLVVDSGNNRILIFELLR